MPGARVELSNNVEVYSACTAHSCVIGLLQATTFGSDGLRYQRLEVMSQLQRFNNPTFFHALSDNELIGVYVLDKRELLLDGRRIDGYYRGALAVDVQWQGRGVGKALTRAARQWLENQSREAPLFTYGCMDQDNHRALSLLESGGATIGYALGMYMMYRQWPLESVELLPIQDRHQEQVHKLTHELYGQCKLRDVSTSCLPGYILEDNDGVAVSARIAHSSFKITRMSSMATWCTRLFVNPLPFARRRFNPDCFRYVCFSEVLIRAGSESQWRRFVSSVLARNQCHFGIVYVDPESELFSRLQKSHPLSRILHSSTGNLRVVWQVFGESESNAAQLSDVLSPMQLWPVDA